MNNNTDNFSAAQVLELATHHARVESQKRLDALMDTLVKEPVYQFCVQGLTLQGGTRVRRYYQQFFDNSMSHVKGGRRIALWGDEKAVSREDAIEIKGTNGPEIHRIMSVLFVQGDRLGGERIYASDHVVQMMAGEMYGELEQITN